MAWMDGEKRKRTLKTFIATDALFKQPLANGS
jgi:hypothetical protein